MGRADITFLCACNEMICRSESFNAGRAELATSHLTEASDLSKTLCWLEILQHCWLQQAIVDVALHVGRTPVGNGMTNTKRTFAAGLANPCTLEARPMQGNR